MPDPATEYSDRRTRWQAAATRAQRIHTRIAHGRLAAFILALLLAMGVFSSLALPAWLLAAPILALFGLALWHERVSRRWRQAEEAVRYYDAGLARLADRWAGCGNAGEQFLDANHLYAADLDLFGKGSLFELLCVCRTQFGERTLAEWLKTPARITEIRTRQEACGELSPELDFRESLALAGSQLNESVETEALCAWGAAPALLPWDYRRILLDLSVLLTVACGLLWAMDWAPFSLIFLGVVAQMSYVAWMAARVRSVLGPVEARGRDLQLLAALVTLLQTRQWRTAKLAELRGNLGHGDDSAAAAIAALSDLLDRLAWRHNAMFLPMAALLLWGTRQAFAIDLWRQRYGSRLEGWLTAVAEFETLVAFAGYAYEHPDSRYPTLCETGPRLSGTAFRHPLMPAGQCVPNSVTLDVQRPLLIVSGSNMSGKSTLLRVVGLQAVMALAGLPVPAERLEISALSLGATLRIQDSLHEGRSRFFAEILRLRELMRRAEAAQPPASSPPLLFLLDEILHGTNSHDRRIGAAAVVKGLLERGAIGLVTTHDLALTELAAELPGRAENVHFADRLDGGSLDFDYTMRPGVVRNSNALALMKAIGLEVDAPHAN